MKKTNNKERTEPAGITTSYNPVSRTMTILDSSGNTIQDFSQRDIEYPTRVVFEIESFCSSGCKYCSEGKDTKCRRNIPKERLVELIDEVEEMKVHELTLRGGEATEHPYFNEVWDYASKREISTPNLITNGMALDKKRVDKILANPNSKLIVSLDGFKETNSINRNPKQYDIVMSWLPQAIKEHPEQLVVLSCLYRQNYNEVPKFAKFLAELGIGHYHLPPLKRLGRSEMADENFVSLNEMNTLQRKLEEIAGEFNGFRPVISCAELEKFAENKTKDIPVPLFNEMYYGSGMKITPEGNIMVNRGIMFTDRFKSEINTPVCLEPLGNIKNKSLKQIWKESRDLRLQQEKIANKHYAYYLGWLNSLK